MHNKFFKDLEAADSHEDLSFEVMSWLAECDYFNKRIVKPESSLLQFAVRMLTYPKQVYLLRDLSTSARLMTHENDSMRIATIKKNYYFTSHIPAFFREIVRLPAEILEWIWGTDRVTFMNLLPKTEIGKRASLEMPDYMTLYEFPGKLKKYSSKGKMKGVPNGYTNKAEREPIGFIELNSLE